MFDNDIDDFQLLINMYGKLAPNMSHCNFDDYTVNEKIYIQLQFLASMVRNYQNSPMCSYYDDKGLNYVAEKLDHLSHFSAFEEIDYKMFPFRIQV